VGGDQTRPGQAPVPAAAGMGDMLLQFFAVHLPEARVEIADLKNTSLGRSRQNWSFDLIWSDGGRSGRDALILRRDPLGGLVESDRAREFALIQALAATGLPVPAARWLDADGRWFGRPSLIMSREPGSCDYYLLTGSRPVEERLDLAHRMCDLLAQVHQVDWKGTGLGALMGDPGPDAARAQIEEWTRVLENDRLEALPEIELTARWLSENAPRSQATVLVHSDFKPGNVLVEDGRVVALLDWELAHLGDPLEDLGWATQPLRHREHMIRGVWERDQILARYQELTGFEVDPAALRWWNLFATFRTAVMQVSGLRSFIEGRSEEPYRPTAKVLKALLDAVAAEEEACARR
jgi:aminoglycoside phosphotransferase (APT) family kinase protein